MGSRYAGVYNGHGYTLDVCVGLIVASKDDYMLAGNTLAEVYDKVQAVVKLGENEK